MNHNNSDIDCTIFNSALIIAKNKLNDEESNGIGKTTVGSAIEYCLFGEVPTKTLKSAVRDGTDKCKVIFDFDLNDNVYRVERITSVKGKTDLNVYQLNSDEWQKISGTRVPEAEELLNKITKISYKAWKHSVKFAQYDLNGLADIKSNDRKGILQEPLQLSDYSKLTKLTNKRSSLISKDIDRVESAIQTLGDPAADIKAAEAELKVSESSIQSNEVSILKLNATLEEKRQFLESLKSALNSTDFEIHDKITQLNKRSKDLSANIEKINERIQSNNKAINDNNLSCNELRKKLSDVNKKIILCNGNKYRLADDINIDLNKVGEDELYGTKLLARFEAEYDQANKSLPNGDLCSYCLQPITPEHRQKCEDELNKVLEQKSTEIKTTKANLTRCQNKKKKLQAELQDAQKAENELKTLNHNAQTIQQELDLRSKNIHDAEQRLESASKELGTNQAELTVVLENLNALQDQAKKSSVPELNNKIFIATDEIKVFEKLLEDIRTELSNAQKRHGAAQEKLSIATNNLLRINELKKEANEYRYKLNIHQLAEQTFGPSGIPTFIIRTIIDELQTETSFWLSKLRSELEVQLDKDLELFFRVNGAHRDWEHLSVGQKVYIIFSLKLGLSRVIQKRLGIDIRLLILDEVDQSLDIAGKKAFADIVKELQNDFVILAISHNEQMKDKFNYAILVEGNGKDGANAKVVSSW